LKREKARESEKIERKREIVGESGRKRESGRERESEEREGEGIGREDIALFSKNLWKKSFERKKFVQTKRDRSTVKFPSFPACPASRYELFPAWGKTMFVE
jgi:hypothetical protein